MLPFITSIVLLACLLHNAAGAPQKRLALESPKPTATMGSLTEDNAPTCVEQFNHPYCRQINGQPRNAMFPNPRGQYMADAMKEFNDFATLMDKGCSEKLGTLLCFFYFPFCTPGYSIVIKPCRSLCEEVTRDCAEALTAAFAETGLYNRAIGWKDLPHFNCTGLYEGGEVFIEKEGHCANSTQPQWYHGILDPAPGPTQKSISDEEEDVTTDASKAKETPTPTEAPTCSPDPVCEKCKIRSGTNGKTFIKNDYNFAFRGTLNSKDATDGCKRALNFTVHTTYDLKSRENCDIACEIPAGDTVLVLGSNIDDCENCFEVFENEKLHLIEGEDYLVAGITRNRVGSCDEKSWLLPGPSATSLIAEWDDNKFDHRSKKNKRITTHIHKGNEDRCP